MPTWRGWWTRIRRGGGVNLMIEMGQVIALIGAAAICVFSGQALADGPSQEQMSEAARLYKAMDGDQRVDAWLVHFEPAIVRTLVQSSGKPDSQVRSAVDKLIMPDLRMSSSSIRGAYETLLAERLSIDDMKALETFFGSPLGLRYRAAFPALAEGLYSSNEKWFAAAYTAAYRSHYNDLVAAGVIVKPTLPPKP